MAKSADVERAVGGLEDAIALLGDDAGVVDRLPTGTLDKARALHASLSGSRTALAASRADSKVATRSERETAKAGAELVSRVRARVRESDISAAAKQAYGVGTVVRPESTTAVATALGKIIDRATSKPDEAAAAGVTTGDVDRARAYLTALGASDAAQRGKKGASKGATASAAQQLKEGLAIVRTVAAAGALHHHGNPAKVRAYDDLRDSVVAPRKKRTTDPAPAP